MRNRHFWQIDSMILLDSHHCSLVFSETLQLYFETSAIVIRCCLSSVCRRLWRECIVIKQQKLGSCSFHWNVAKCQTLCLPSLMTKFDWVPSIAQLKLGWGGFWLRYAIYLKWCEIELMWELITRKSYVGFRLQQKSMTLNDLECQFTALS